MTTERGRPIVFDRLITLHIPGADTGNRDSLNHPIYEAPTERRVWASRSDSPSLDQLHEGGGIVAAIATRRYTIRKESAAGVETGSHITDENGDTLRVLGKREYARRRVEILVQAIG